MSRPNKKPDFELWVKPADSPFGNCVGVAWTTNSGAIRLKLRPGVVLSWNDELMCTLFPKRNEDAPGNKPESPSFDSSNNDDFPF